MSDLAQKYQFDITCGDCGGDLHHVAAGRSTGISAGAIAKCSDCKHEWLVRVELMRAAWNATKR